MNSRQQAQLERYSPVLQNFSNLNLCTGKGIKGECDECDKECFFTSDQVRYALSKGHQLECKNCKVSIPKGFSLIEATAEYKLLECDKCFNQYHREKDTEYFKCYCMLKKKKTEALLYKALAESLDETFGLSREEMLIDHKTHKADIKLTRDDCVIYIEVDGGSHESRTQKDEDRSQERHFTRNSYEDEFLFRIPDALIQDPVCLDKLVEFILNVDIEYLNCSPIHKITTKHLEEVE